MKQNLAQAVTDRVMPRHGAEAPQPQFDKVADKVATATLATMVVQSGRGLFATMAKNPWLMFGLGVASGCLAYKYRKEIIALSKQTAKQGKDFWQRQKQAVTSLLNTEEGPQAQQREE